MSGADGTPESVARWPRWAKAVLILSLGVNLLVLGLAVGFALRWPELRAAPVNLQVHGYSAIVRAMPPKERLALRGEMRARGGELRASRRDLRTLNVAFFDALRAEPFSPQEISRILAEQGMIWQAFGDTSREVLVARIAGMSDAERQGFADRLEKELRKRWRPNGGSERRP